MTSPNSTFFIKQNDTLPVIQEYLRNADGTAINLSGASVAFHMMFGDGTLKVNSGAVIDNAVTGLVHYAWVGVDTNTAGTFYREWQVTTAGGGIVTTPNWTDYPVQITAQIA